MGARPSSGAPQSPQNFLAAGFSLPQFEHRISALRKSGLNGLFVALNVE
jgi:hypothetical protein